jgi:hypothetical protein
MAAKTLTREQGYALQDSGKAARLSVNHLATRTAMYVWNDDSTVWECQHNGLRIAHCKGTGRGFLWRPSLKQFVRCTCEQCNK